MRRLGNEASLVDVYCYIGQHVNVLGASWWHDTASKSARRDLASWINTVFDLDRTTLLGIVNDQVLNKHEHGDQQLVAGLLKSLKESIRALRCRDGAHSPRTTSAPTSAATSVTTSSIVFDRQDASRILNVHKSPAATRYRQSTIETHFASTNLLLPNANITCKDQTQLANHSVPHQISSLKGCGFGQVTHAFSPAESEWFRPDVVVTGNKPDRAHGPSERSGNKIINATIRFNAANVGPLFETRMSINQVQRSNRVERQYGWHRFLYAELVIDRRTMTKFTRGYTHAFNTEFRAWLNQPVVALSRTWQAFYYKDSEKGASGQKTIKVSFFATEGAGIQSIALHDFLNSMVHFRHNANQPYLKLFSRLDLVLSRTIPTHIFERSAFHIIDDPTPSTNVDHDPYRDPEIEIGEHQLRPFNALESMNDGCGLISVGANKLVQLKLGLGTFPSAVQFRGFGTKGVLAPSGPEDTKHPAHLVPWIQVVESQVKIRLPDTPSDFERSIDVVQWSKCPKPAYIHRDFVQPLIDRGVRKEYIHQLAKASQEAERRAWLDALIDPPAMAVLLHTKFSDNVSPLVRKAQKLFNEGGFSPLDNDYAAALVLRLYGQAIATDLERSRIKATQCTQLFGVAIISEVLKPHEIFCSFSPPFDEGSGELATSLAGKEVVIARDPTLRASDIQKFIAVDRPELAHLKNVIVFSSRGKMPAGAKMQGGDYDGDVYWITWDKNITSPFRNVPVLRSKSAAELSIRQDTRTVADLVGDIHDATSCATWLQSCFEFRAQPPMLGTITNYLYKLTYHFGLWDVQAMECADLHDFIIDAEKNGWSFSAPDFELWKARFNGRERLGQPRWKSNLGELKTHLAERSSRPWDHALRLRDFCLNAVKTRHKTFDSIHDELWFQVRLPEAAKSIQLLMDRLPRSSSRDDDLRTPIRLLEESPHVSSQQLAELIGHTGAELSELSAWINGQIGNSNTQQNQQFWDRVEAKYAHIGPTVAFQHLQWSLTTLGHTQWDLLKASVLADLQFTTKARIKSNRVFLLALDALCTIKSQSTAGASRVDMVKAILRPKRQSNLRQAVGAEPCWDVHMTALTAQDTHDSCLNRHTVDRAPQQHIGSHEPAVTAAKLVADTGDVHIGDESEDLQNEAEPWDGSWSQADCFLNL